MRSRDYFLDKFADGKYTGTTGCVCGESENTNTEPAIKRARGSEEDRNCKINTAAFSGTNENQHN